jgi:hypothetical protein
MEYRAAAVGTQGKRLAQDLGKVGGGSRTLRDHPAIRELVDRLTLPSLERWSPTRARDGLFLAFVEQRERLGRRSNRKRLPPRPQPRGGGVTVRSKDGATVRSFQRLMFSAAELAEYERAVLKDPAYGADRREFYASLNHFEENWAPPIEFAPPRHGGPTGDPLPWGGRRKQLYGADRAALLKRAFAAVQAAHPSWKARPVWTELATVVSALSDRLVTGAQLADLARPLGR